MTEQNNNKIRIALAASSSMLTQWVGNTEPHFFIAVHYGMPGASIFR